MKDSYKIFLPAKLAAVLLIFNAAGFSAFAQEKITLQQAVQEALQNNLQIKQAQLNEALSEENLKESKLARLPTLNAGSSLNFNFGRNVDPFSYQFVNEQITSANGSVYTSLPLFQGGLLHHQISQNKFLLEADKSTTQKAKNDLSLNVVTSYLAILNNEDLLTAAKQQLAIAQQQLSRIQKQYDAGGKTLADLAQGKSQAATAELNVTNAQNQLDISNLDLAQLMERDPASKFEIDRPVIDEIGQLNTAYTAAEIFNQSVKEYPDIKAAEYERLAAQTGIKAAKSSLYPRLSFQGSAASGYSSRGQHIIGVDENGPIYGSSDFGSQLSENFNQTVGFSLSIPIFNGSSSRIAVNRAKIRYQNALYAEELQKNNLNKVINQAVLDLKAAEKRYYSAKSAYESSKTAFYAIEQRYNVGLVNSLDYNQSQTELNQAEFDVIQAKYDLIFRSKLIDFYLGNPLTF